MAAAWENLYELPPVGTATDGDHARFADVRSRLATESKNERDKWIPIRNACLNIFNYGDYQISGNSVTSPADDQFIINHAQGDLIGDKDVMFREPVQIEISAEDDGTDVLAYYWNGPDVIQQPVQTTDPLTGAPVNGMQSVPVASLGIQSPKQDPVTGELVAQPIDEATAQRLMGMGFPPKWIVAATNKVVSDIEQMVFDADWRSTYCDEWLDQFVMGTLKGGWRTTLYMHDDEGHQFHAVPVTNAYPDPTKQFAWEWDYCVVHVVFRLAVAQRLWPQYAVQLAARSQTGTPKSVDSNTQMGYAYDRDFQTRTVTLSITWLRNQPMPLDAKDAVRGGQIQQVIPEPTPEPVPAESAQGASPDSPAAQPSPSVMPPSQQRNLNMPPRYQAMGKDGTPVEVTNRSEQWPMRYVLRQFIMLDDIVIEDDECPWPWIPMIHATCIPFEDTPFGFSPLWKMRFSQRADSQMAEAMAANCEYIGRPPAYMSNELKNRMAREYQSAFVDPAMVLGLLEDDFNANGQPKVGFIDLPEMNEHHVKGRQQMQADRKELGGYTDAVKGIPVTADAPAELQKLTMSAASGVLSSISKHLQGTIKYAAQLMLHSQLFFTDFDKIWKRCKRYRRPVLAAMHLHHGQQISWKVEALLASGSGAQRREKRGEMLSLNQARDPATGMPLVDAESVQEAWNLDPETVRKRNQRNVEQAAMTMAPMTAAGGSAPAPDASNPQQSKQPPRPQPLGAPSGVE